MSRNAPGNGGRGHRERAPLGSARRRSEENRRAGRLFSEDEELAVAQEYDAMHAALAERRPRPHKAMYAASFAPENRDKNRYRDVLPLEKTRVKLEPVDGEVGSDYINANHVIGTGGGKTVQRYICAQAPLPNTFGDFWRMIWEQNVPVIVMLTKLCEKMRIKANRYWPEDADHILRFGTLTVQLKRQFSHTKNIYVRIFTLTRGEESRDVSQLHYTEWPDYGVPPSTEVMRDLITELDIRKKGKKDPIVVHCSAGIGRTGTFLAIHINLQKALTGEEPLDIMDTVCSLREQRDGMVQSRDQYKFVYATLRDVLTQRQVDVGPKPPPPPAQSDLSSSSSSSSFSSSSSAAPQHLSQSCFSPETTASALSASEATPPSARHPAAAKPHAVSSSSSSSATTAPTTSTPSSTSTGRTPPAAATGDDASASTLTPSPVAAAAVASSEEKKSKPPIPLPKARYFKDHIMKSSSDPQIHKH